MKKIILLNGVLVASLLGNGLALAQVPVRDGLQNAMERVQEKNVTAQERLKANQEKVTEKRDAMEEKSEATKERVAEKKDADVLQQAPAGGEARQERQDKEKRDAVKTAAAEKSDAMKVAAEEKGEELKKKTV